RAVSSFQRIPVSTCMSPSFHVTRGNLMRMLTATLICCSVVSLASAADALAAMRKPTTIPAQALRPALQLLSKEREVQVVFRTDIVADLQTKGASGDLTVDEALQQLLVGTGLTFRYLDENTVTIVPVVSAQTSRQSSPASELKLAQAD